MRQITLAIHTYDRAIALKALLEAEGIPTTLQNVNLEQPEVSPGVRVRIGSGDLPLALRIVENPELFVGDSFLTGDGRLPGRVILVPVDFDGEWQGAVAMAATLAARHGAALQFIHSYIRTRAGRGLQLGETLTYALPDSEAGRRERADAEEALNAFCGRVRNLMKDGRIPAARFTASLVEGVPEEAIVQYARKSPPFLTVMATRPSARKAADMIGSVTAEAVEEGRFSVLSVPGNYPAGSGYVPANILFFGNLDQEDIIALDALYRFFPNTRAHVTILHMAHRRTRFSDRAEVVTAHALTDYCSRNFRDFSFGTVPLSSSNVLSGIEEIMQSRPVDLLVVPNRRTNRLLRFFMPGLTNELLFHIDLPMLVIPV